MQTHRVTMAALRQLADGERPAYTFHVQTPRSWVPARTGAGCASTSRPSSASPTPPTTTRMISSTVNDDLVTHVVVDPIHLPAQVDALDAHRTQLRVWPGGYYALTNDARRAPGRVARRSCGWTR